MERRDFLLGCGLTLGVATAGCSGVTEGLLTFEADPATVPAEVTEEAGYERVGVEDVVIEREVEVAGQTRTVEVTNWRATYEKTLDLGPIGEQRAGLFTALSSPSIEILGRTFNPLADMTASELAQQVQSRYDRISGLEEGPSEPVTILGTETTQTRFSGTMQLESGMEVDVYLHVSDPVEHEGDLVVAAGGYPQKLPDEGEHVLAMMKGIEHQSGSSGG